MVQSCNYVFWGLIFSLALGACVAPDERFDEFSKSVPTIDSIDIAGCGGMALPDFSGEFYMAVEPNIAAGTTLEFIATVSVDTSGETPMADFSFQPLCVQNVCGDDLRQGIGDALVKNDVLIDDECKFIVPFEDVVVEGNANPVSGSPLEGDVAVEGAVKSAELFCGEFSGILSAPIPDLDLAGSTFGAISIEPGTIGSDLPAPVFKCP